MTAAAAPFIAELETKNHESLQRLLTSYSAAIAQEGFGVADLLKLEIKMVVETVEVAALWIPDAEPLAMKVALAGRCGDGARHFGQIAERLAALGVAVGSFDPQHGGYSKLFALMRSLQTPEERLSAGNLTLGRMNVMRYGAIAALCEEKGDPETARLFRETLADDEQRQVESGRGALVELVPNEESQARARRAGYRTIELLGDALDVAALRKFLKGSARK